MVHSIQNRGAEWKIYARDDSAKVQEYLRSRCPLGTDPMCARTLYVTSALEDEIAEVTGARPFQFVQREGDVVFIPAGCPHQVHFLFYQKLSSLIFFYSFPTLVLASRLPRTSVRLTA